LLHNAAPNLNASQITADAVVAEVALLLRMGLSPADMLGYAGEGRFVILLFEGSQSRAASVARQMQAVVAGETGLHPDGQTRLNLSLGVTISTPASSPESLLAEAEARRRQEELAGSAGFGAGLIGV
jgi:PleD family two-component response regulator